MVCDLVINTQSYMKLIISQSGWCGNQCAAASVCILHRKCESVWAREVRERDVVLKEEKQKSPAALQHLAQRKLEGFGAGGGAGRGADPHFCTQRHFVLGQARHTLLMRHWLIQSPTLTFLFNTCFHSGVIVWDSEWMVGGCFRDISQLTHKTAQAKQMYACFVPPGLLS